MSNETDKGQSEARQDIDLDRLWKALHELDRNQITRFAEIAGELKVRRDDSAGADTWGKRIFWAGCVNAVVLIGLLMIVSVLAARVDGLQADGRYDRAERLDQALKSAERFTRMEAEMRHWRQQMQQMTTGKTAGK